MVSENIKAAIDDKGLKQKFISEKTGISEVALSAMLNGRQKIGAEDFYAIACVLEMSCDDLYNYKKGA